MSHDYYRGRLSRTNPKRLPLFKHKRQAQPPPNEEYLITPYSPNDQLVVRRVVKE